MNKLEVWMDDNYTFIIAVNDIVVYGKSLNSVDVLKVMNLLCKNYDISAGEHTLSLYNFIDEKVKEFKAQKAENEMNIKFFEKVV